MLRLEADIYAHLIAILLDDELLLLSEVVVAHSGVDTDIEKELLLL